MDKPMISVDPAVFVRLLAMAQAKHADDGVFLDNIAAALKRSDEPAAVPPRPTGEERVALPVPDAAGG